MFNQYCVYHTTYSGNKLPANYIGSTTVKRIIDENYHGSVCSKKYKTIWESELKERPELFKTEIISYQDTRSDALYKELQSQKLFNAVKNPSFINMSYANYNGCYGTSLKGSDNPAFQREYKPSKETRNLIKQSAIDFPRTWVKNDIESLFILKSDLSCYLVLGYTEGRTFKRIKPAPISKSCSCIKCHQELQINNIGNHWLKHFPTQEFIDKNKMLSNSRRKRYIVTNPNNISQIVTNMNHFCAENHLTPQLMRSVAKGKQTNHKGWLCKEIV